MIDKTLLASSEVLIGYVLSHAGDPGIVERIRVVLPDGKLFAPGLGDAWEAVLTLTDDNKTVAPETVAHLSRFDVDELYRCSAGSPALTDFMDIAALIHDRGLVVLGGKIGEDLAAGRLPVAEAVTRLMHLEDYGYSQRPIDAKSVGVTLREKLEQDVQPGALTGLGHLAAWTYNFAPERSTIIAAPQKAGKTTLMRNIMLAAASRGFPVMAVMAEGTQEGMAADCVAMIANQYLRQTAGSAYASDKTTPILSGEYILQNRSWRQRPAQRAAVDFAQDVFAKLPIQLLDTRDGADDPEHVKSLLRRVPASIVLVDYIQQMGFPGEGIYERMEHASRWMKRMVVAGCHLVVLSQMNEEAIRGTAGGSAGLKGGGSIVAQADLILKVERPEHAEGEPDTMKVFVDRGRRTGPGQMCLFYIEPVSGLITGYRIDGDGHNYNLVSNLLGEQPEMLLD